MIDTAKITETVERLFDAFDEAASAPDVSVLNALLAAHLFLIHVEEYLTPDERRQYRQDMRSFQDAYDGAPETFS